MSTFIGNTGLTFDPDSLRARNSSIYDLRDLQIHLIGCGAIGSFTASTLARMGVINFNIFDDDTVTSENIGVQDFTFHQLGMDKTKAVKQNITSINPAANISIKPWRVDENTSSSDFTSVHDNAFFERYQSRGRLPRYKHVFIMAVDSMEARMKIAQSSAFSSGCSLSLNANRDSDKTSYLYDARMGSETFQLYRFPLPLILKDYMSTWYSDEDGDSEPCSARSTSYCSTLAGSMIASEIKKHESGGLGAEKIIFNFPSLLLDSDTDFSSLKRLVS
jgi:hypothetical protein|tara:strand:- start:6533 stop:7360 length:828 start_codon:yes stop_codon:yes gene_type:complete